MAALQSRSLLVLGHWLYAVSSSSSTSLPSLRRELYVMPDNEGSKIEQKTFSEAGVSSLFLGLLTVMILPHDGVKTDLSLATRCRGSPKLPVESCARCTSALASSARSALDMDGLLLLCRCCSNCCCVESADCCCLSEPPFPGAAGMGWRLAIRLALLLRWRGAASGRLALGRR